MLSRDKLRVHAKKILARLKGVPTLEEELTSLELRKRFAKQHRISVGLYSYGCFSPSRINPHTTFGRYCSVANSAYVFNRNHGTDFLSTSAYLYNSRLGIVEQDTISYAPCVVGDDVWIGHNAVLLPRAQNIGRGAVIAAGAIVTRDVPAYAIVAGNPAKVVAYRFDPEIISAIEQSGWWTCSPDEIRATLSTCPDFFFRPHIAFSSLNRT